MAGIVPAANAANAATTASAANTQATGRATAAGAAADPSRRVDRAELDAGLRAVVAPGGATAALGRVSEDGRTLWKGAAGTAGRLLGPAELAEMKHSTGLGRGADYGLGLERTPTPCGDFWGHRVDGIGYSSVMLGNDTGQRQIMLSRNPYDPVGQHASEVAFTTLVTTAACAGRTA
ncbi:hypothetical protein ACGF0D_18995 [Kitasatospora sp. NPDC048298]|uniref:hypothetical protein n=1 Tax=Kitasatospora sp. NPDC048298 TaxID=3364049 RepID=UPI00371B5F78